MRGSPGWECFSSRHSSFSIDEIAIYIECFSPARAQVFGSHCYFVHYAMHYMQYIYCRVVLSLTVCLFSQSRPPAPLLSRFAPSSRFAKLLKDFCKIQEEATQAFAIFLPFRTNNTAVQCHPMINFNAQFLKSFIASHQFGIA